MRNYNSRSHALECPQSTRPGRWYMGRDRSEAIAERERNGRPRHGVRPQGYIELLDQFGRHLHNSGLTSLENLRFLWPLESSPGPAAYPYYDGNANLQ